MEFRRKKKPSELINGNLNANKIHIKANTIYISKRKLINIILRKLNMISKIHLQINGTGNQNVLSSSFSSVPDQIIVNGIIQNYTDKMVKNLVQDINNITLIWNTALLTSCNSMFENLMNITKIDMSEFKSSSVTDMSYMFSGCGSLKELNLNNLVTNSVIDMRGMFYNCNH